MIVRPMFFVLAVLLAAASLAADPPLFPDVVLSPERVETVIAAYLPMREEVEARGADLDADGSAVEAAQRLMGVAAIDPANSALDGAARRLGFGGYLDWMATTYAVFMAHGFAQHPEVDADLQDALDEVEKQPDMSAEQKEHLRQMLLHSMGALAAMRPSDENIAAVAPYRDQIEAILTE